MTANFVLSKRVAGTSRDDAELDINQFAEGDDYEISDPKRMIASYMHMYLINYVDSGYSIGSVRKLLDKNGVYQLKSLDEEQQVYVIVNNKEKTYRYDVYGEYSIRHVFYVKEYDTDNIVYLASEHILNPEPECDLIMRCYRPYFDTAGAANRYCAHNMNEYALEKGSSASGYRVLVEDKTALEESPWYKKNIKAAKYIAKYELDAKDYRYIVDIDDVLDSITADAYDDLPVDERAAIDRRIYNSIRDFISADSCYSIDETIDGAEGEDLKNMVDVAIVLAFAQAEDEETFHNIYKALGPNDYRVGGVTDDTYNDHPDQGFIMITKDGQLGWFPPSDFFLNEWEGMRNTPFYKKLQPNENDTLFCLRELHPDLFVDALPTPIEMDKYRRMYRAFVAEKRREHPEFNYQKRGDKTYACGDWYPKGAVSDECYTNTMFLAQYGSHLFTEDECKDLLSGVEVVVEHYMLKMGIESTIRGKLRRSAPQMFDDEPPEVKFMRTDMGSKMRTSLNMEFGIVEAPPSEDGIK